MCRHNTIKLFRLLCFLLLYTVLRRCYHQTPSIAHSLGYPEGFNGIFTIGAKRKIGRFKHYYRYLSEKVFRIFFYKITNCERNF